ncbi:PREDICTED: gamma-glutamyltranspeptidase 1-like [Priapulus caudatus]|uniref:Gamma-glutamyltranspeptidase 1-like n=1 Tax=Priapulus caudatus TaxID=37621 RepID=A0ABM1FC41_PRICU|nr:PREDICTED: gamma-glutamyltranspeptidase 1-like [Priapulus caudatus]
MSNLVDIPLHSRGSIDRQYLAQNSVDSIGAEDADKFDGSRPTLTLKQDSVVSPADTSGSNEATRAENWPITQPAPMELEESEKKASPCLQTGSGLKNLIASSIIFSAGITIALIVQISVGTTQIDPHGAVISDVPLCSGIGKDILQQGGTAVEAAITTVLCVGLVNPHSTGLGGGGFMLIRDFKRNKVSVIDFREVAPKKITEYLGGTNASHEDLPVGGIVGIPGMLKGMATAHEQYKKLSWEKLFTPVIHLAEQGFDLTADLEKALKKFTYGELSAFGNMSLYYTYNGKWKTAGDLVTRVDLASSLRVIASQGSDSFYEGGIANSIVRAVSAAGGVMSRNDLKTYDAIERLPLSLNISGYNMRTVGAPASGAVVLSALNILEGLGIKADNLRSNYTYHCIIEALKFAFAQQSSLGDPDFQPRVDNITKLMLDKEAAALLRSKISVDSVIGDYEPFVEGSERQGTAHVSVIDQDDVVVSVTSSLGSPFGSKIMTSSGILLNDAILDFDRSTHNPENQMMPGKRPLSDMAPLIFQKLDKPCGLRGASGATKGSHIISSLVQVMVSIISGGSSVTDAIESPRLHPDARSNKVYIEEDFPRSTVDGLKAKGHNIESVPKGIGVVNVLDKTEDIIAGHADSRGTGKIAKY